MAALDFDANEVEPQSFEPLPAGKYNVVVIASDTRPVKSGSGSYLQLTLEVIDGEYEKRQLWWRLNLDNANQKAVQIARSQLSMLCRAVGVMTPRDSVELHNLPFVSTVRCIPRKDTKEIVNEIGACMPFVRGTTTATDRKTTTPENAATGAPWARKLKDGNEIKEQG